MHHSQKQNDNSGAECNDLDELFRTYDCFPSDDRDRAVTHIQQVIRNEQNLVDLMAKIFVIGYELRHENVSVVITNFPHADDNEKCNQQINRVTQDVKIHGYK